MMNLMDMKNCDSKEILENYMENYQRFSESNSNITVIGEKIKNKKDALSQLEREEQRLLEERKKLENDSKADIECEEDCIQQRQQKELDLLEQEKKKASDSILLKKEKRIKDNEMFLNNALKEYESLGEVRDKSSLNKVERGLYDLMARRDSINNKKQCTWNEIEDSVNRLRLETNNIINAYQMEQNGIVDEYAAEIQRLQGIISLIEEKHAPAISEVEELLHGLEVECSDEITELRLQCDREVEKYEVEKKSIEKQYKQTDRHFKRQISFATIRNEPVAQLKVQHNAALNSYQKQKTKKEETISKTINAYEKKEEAIRNKWKKKIDKESAQRDKLIQLRQSELEKPQSELDSLLRERDKRIAVIEESKQKVSFQTDNACRDLEEKWKDYVVQVDTALEEERQRMIQFAIDHNMAADEESKEIYRSFEPMEDNLPVWMDSLTKLVMNEKIDDLIDSQSSKCCSYDYDKLIFTAEKSLDSYKKLPMYLIGIRDKMIILLAVCVFAATVLKFLLHATTSAALSVPLIAFAVIVIAINDKKKKIVEGLSECIYLANNYKQLPQITERVKISTDNAIYEQTNTLAEQLYKMVSGPEKAKQKYSNVARDIENDYSNEIAVINAEFENKKAAVLGETKKTIEALREKNLRIKKSRSEKLRNMNGLYTEKTIEINKLNKELSELQADLADEKKFVDEFEQIYANFIKAFPQLSAPIQVTNGLLRDYLYIVPINDERCTDENGHLPIVYVEHTKRPLLFLYDTFMIRKDVRYQEKLNDMISDCLCDIMAAFKNINSTDNIEQYVVDEVGGAYTIRNDKYKKLFHIKKVSDKFNDFQEYFRAFEKQKNMYSERGMTIDDFNEQRIKNGERPETYKIFIMVLKGERCSGSLDIIKTLMNNGDKFGFIPVFLCDIELWNEYEDKPNTIQHEISLSGAVKVKFDGKKYEVIENE